MNKNYLKMKKILMFAVSALLMGGLMMSCGPKQPVAPVENDAIEIMDEPITEEEVITEEAPTEELVVE